MSRREAQHRHSPRSSDWDPEEVHESEPTRAARPSYVSPSDLAGLAVFSSDPDAETRAPRASHVASRELEPFARDSSENPTRSARESYVALTELPQMPMYDRAQGSDEAFADEVVEDEVTAFVDRSSDEQRADGPDSVTTFAVRPSYVAHDELATSEERLAYATSEIEEVAEVDAAEPFDFAPPIPSGSFKSGPDYEALSRYLFDDMPPPAGDADVLAPEAAPASYPRQPAACFRQPMPSRLATDETPVQPLVLPSAIGTHRSRMSMPDTAPEPASVPPAPMRRPMHSIHPDDVAAMQPMRRSMHSIAPENVAAMQPMHPHDVSGSVQPARRSMPSVHSHDVSGSVQSARRSMPSMHPHDVAAAMQSVHPLAVVTPIPSMRRSMHPHDVGAPMHSMRRSMHSMHPHDVAAPMPSMRRSMPSMHPHDSSAESPWIVTMGPSTSRRGAPLAQPAPSKVTASSVAAAMIALLAIGVMVAGVLFVHSDDSDGVRSKTSAAQLDVPSPVAVPTEPALPPVTRPTTITITAPEDAPPALAPTAVMLVPSSPAAVAAPPVQVGAGSETVATPAPVVAAQVVPAVNPAPIAAAPKPHAPSVAPAAPQAAARTTSSAPPAKKADTKAGAKSVEDILSELGEEQLRR